MPFHKTPMGFQIDYSNGWTASVQFGPGNYCSNRDMNVNPFRDDIKFMESETAEIAAWRTEARTAATTNGWYQFEDGQEVKGWQNATQVMQFLNMVHLFHNVKYDRPTDDNPSHWCPENTEANPPKVLTAEDVQVASKKWKPILKDWGIDY
jgi:hypothetical protein